MDSECLLLLRVTHATDRYLALRDLVALAIIGRRNPVCLRGGSEQRHAWVSKSLLAPSKTDFTTEESAEGIA